MASRLLLMSALLLSSSAALAQSGGWRAVLRPGLDCPSPEVFQPVQVEPRIPHVEQSEASKRGDRVDPPRAALGVRTSGPLGPATVGPRTHPVEVHNILFPFRVFQLVDRPGGLPNQQRRPRLGPR